MKILWLPHVPWPADGQREGYLIERLRSHGHAVHVLTWEVFNRPLALARTLRYYRWTDGGVVIHHVPRFPNLVSRFTGDYAQGFLPNAWLMRQYARRVIREERIELFIYGLTHKLVGLPPFDVGTARVFDYLDLCTYPMIEDAYLRNSDLVLCTSQVLVERARSLGAQVVYLPNGVDARRIRAGDREATRRRFGIADRVVVSLIGLTYSPTLFFVEALRVAARSVPNIVFLAVGGAPSLRSGRGRDLRERCEQLGVPLIAPGRVPSQLVADYFAASDVGLYPGEATPYFDAACPLKVLEYTMAEKPVVATDLEELRRLRFPNVYLARPDPEAFGAAIARACSARPRVPDLAQFEWTVLGERLNSTVEAVVAGTGRAGRARAAAAETSAVGLRPGP